MLTLVESISLAGDRAKQNDDAHGFIGAAAWVIDGATDLHDKPLTGRASDAAWLAHRANAALHQTANDLRAALRAASAACAEEFSTLAAAPDAPWMQPIASVLIVRQDGEGVEGLDLGDCRCFTLDADGEAIMAGAYEDAADNEAALAAKQTDADKPLLERARTLETLRAARERQVESGGKTFSLDPDCAERARGWRLKLARPAHLLLMTDGFAALTDRYGAYDAAELVRAARDKGLQELGRELRAIENAAGSDAKHPRFKKSDDATALLLRLS